MSYPRINSENAVLLLIDHQVGTAQWMHSGSVDAMKRNTIALAKAAAATGMPVVLTSSQEDQVQGLLFQELESILPKEYATRIKRQGTVDCMADPEFNNAVKSTNRKTVIMAGLLTEVCVLYPAMSAKLENYNVQVIADASGSGTKAGDGIALARMRQEGIHVGSTIQILSEMVEDWSTGPGPAILEVLGELYAAIDAEGS